MKHEVATTPASRGRGGGHAVGAFYNFSFKFSVLWRDIARWAAAWPDDAILHPPPPSTKQ